MGFFSKLKARKEQEAIYREKQRYISGLRERAKDASNYESIHEELWKARLDKDGELSWADKYSKDSELQKIRRLGENNARFQKIKRILEFIEKVKYTCCEIEGLNLSIVAKMKDGCAISIPVHYDMMSSTPMTRRDELMEITAINMKETERLFAFYVDPADLKVSIPYIHFKVSHFGDKYSMNTELDMFDEPLLMDNDTKTVLGTFEIEEKGCRSEIIVTPYEGILKVEDCIVTGKKEFGDKATLTTKVAGLIDAPRENKRFTFEI